MGIWSDVRRQFKRRSVKTDDDGEDNSSPLAYMMQGNGSIVPIKLNGYGASSYIAGYDQLRGQGLLDHTSIGYAYTPYISVWVYRCVNVLARTEARIKWNVYKAGTKEVIKDHPLTRALKRNRQSILRKMSRAVSLFGEIFIEKSRNDFGYPTDLYWLNNLGMYVAIDSTGIYEFQYVPVYSGTPQNFKPHEIAYYHTDNDFNDLRGSSPLDSVLDDIGADQQIARVIRAFYINDARPGVIMIPKRDLLPADATRFIDEWKKQHQGVNNAGKPSLMPFDMTLSEVQRTPSLEDTDLRKNIRQAICAAYGVPLSIAGATEDVNYQSAPEQRKSFYEDTVIPNTEDRRDFINAEIMPFFSKPGMYGYAEFGYDYSDVYALTEDASKKGDTLNAKLTSGLITRAEARREQGHPVTAADDVFYIPSGVTIVPASQVALVTPNNATVDTTPKQQEQPKPAAKPTEKKTKKQPLTLPDLPKASTPPPLPPVPPLQPQAGKSATKVETPCFVILSLADNPAITSIQNDLKMKYPGIQWESPADFHVTLVYSPEGGNLEQITNILPKSINTFSLSLSKLDTFEASFASDGMKPLIMRVAPTPELLALQAGLCASFESLGMELSSYSKTWQPHVTLAYMPVDTPLPDDKVSANVESEVLICSVPNGADYAKVYVTQIKSVVYTSEPDHDEELILNEIEAWRNKAKNKGATKAQSFVCEHIPETVQAFIRDGLASLDKPVDEFIVQSPTTYRSIFNDARTIVTAVKSFDSAAEDFKTTFKNAVHGALSDVVSRRNLGNVLRAALKINGTQAYLDGLGDPESELDDLGRADIDHWLIQQSSFVSNFADELFSEGLSPTEVDRRADMWVNNSLGAIRLEGLVRAKRDKRFMWKYNDEADHCGDCPKLHGQVHRLSQWYGKNITPRSGKTECGLGCKCTLEETNLPSSGRFLG